MNVNMIFDLIIAILFGLCSILTFSRGEKLAGILYALCVIMNFIRMRLHHEENHDRD